MGSARGLNLKEKPGRLGVKCSQAANCEGSLKPWLLPHASEAKQNAACAHRVGRDGFQPVIIKIEENHLGFSSLQDEIPKLFHFQTGLERQLQL